METTTEPTVVRREISIGARPETVWEFLVDPDKATRWMGIAATLDPRPGGEYRVQVLSGNVASGQFVELDRPRRAVWTWGWEPGANSAVLPGESAHVHAGHGLAVEIEDTVAGGDHDVAQAVGIGGLHLKDARVKGAGGRIGSLDQLHTIGYDTTPFAFSARACRKSSSQVAGGVLKPALLSISLL